MIRIQIEKWWRIFNLYKKNKYLDYSIKVFFTWIYFVSKSSLFIVILYTGIGVLYRLKTLIGWQNSRCLLLNSLFEMKKYVSSLLKSNEPCIILSSNGIFNTAFVLFSGVNTSIYPLICSILSGMKFGWIFISAIWLKRWISGGIWRFLYRTVI